MVSLGDVENLAVPSIGQSKEQGYVYMEIAAFC